MLGGTSIVIGGRRNTFEKSFAYSSDGTMFIGASGFVGGFFIEPEAG
jgi:hypothetical protein